MVAPGTNRTAHGRRGGNVACTAGARSGTGALVFAAATIAAACAAAAGPSAGDAPPPAAVSVAMLSYGPEGRSGRCVSPAFLDLAARETTIRVDRAFAAVPLASEELFEYPFCLMTGEGSFELSDAEVAHLRRYLLGGGFLLASAGCSSHPWAVSMERSLGRALPEAALIELPMDHPLFHSLFDVRDFTTRKRRPVRLYGVDVNGRLAVVYSPQGLNDTDEGGMDPALLPAATPTPAGARCCCCTGDEIRSAKYINANALVYALTR